MRKWLVIGRSMVHYIAVLCGAEAPQTQTTEAEREVLCHFLPGRKRIVEIGVFEGFTTRLLAERSDPDAVVYGIDPFFTGRLGISWGERIARNYNRRQLDSGKVKFVRKPSVEVGDDVPKLVDYVFIDGDHSLKGINDDWVFWSGRFENNGIIALHDTLLSQNSPNELGSHQYFKNYIRHDIRFKIVAQQDSLSIVQRI